MADAWRIRYLCSPAPLPDPVHFALDGRHGQTERVRIGAGEHRYLIRHASATEQAPRGVGHAVENGPVIHPADR